MLTRRPPSPLSPPPSLARLRAHDRACVHGRGARGHPHHGRAANILVRYLVVFSFVMLKDIKENIVYYIKS